MDKKYFPSFIAVFILICFLVIDNLFSFGMTKNIGTIFSPVGVVISDIGSNISSFFNGIGNIGNLQKENTDLHSKLN